MDGARIELVSGAGLLDARAMWASIVGPHRLAMAPRKPVTMFLDRTIELVKNLGASDVYVFAGVALPFNSPTNPLAVLFDKNEETGFNNGLPGVLVPQVNMSFSFMQLLLPGEQLYGRIVSPGVATQNVVVSTVMF
jgi:hypothetical protein